MGFSVTLKAQVLEHHMCDFNNQHGVANKNEAFIELMHQVCSAGEKRTANVKNFRQQHECIASRNDIKLNYDVQEKILQVQSSSKREFTGGLISGKCTLLRKHVRGARLF